MERKYKYAHVFTIDSKRFNKAFQYLACEIESSEDHVFIYSAEGSYSCVEADHMENTLLDTSPCWLVEYLRKALELADYVFIHNMIYPAVEVAKLTDEEAARCIWSVWGPDYYEKMKVPPHKSFLYRSLKDAYRLARYGRKVYNQKKLADEYCVWKASLKKMSKFKAICAGFEGDVSNIKKRFPKVSVFQGVYPNLYNLDDILEWKKEIKAVDSEKYRILIGHSGFEHLQHEKWLDKLLPLKDKVELYIPLNYGDPAYIEKIEKKARELYGDEVHILKERMDSRTYYLDIVSIVDFAIFDFNIQSAYGNALMLLSLDKKLFYPEDSVMYRTFINKGISVYRTEDLNEKTLEELKKAPENKGNIDFAYSVLDKKWKCSLWKNVFDSLRN